jgi:serine protease Do
MNKNIVRYKFILLISSFFLLQQQINAQFISPEHNYARNSPAVVMVQAVFSATVYVNEVKINERLFDKLVDSVKRLDTTGTILSPGQKLDIVVKALYKSPFRFFSAGNNYFRQAHRVNSTGTGFLISDDGYVVTNCHIIDRDSAFIRSKFVLETFQEVTRGNINSLQSSWAMTLTEQQRDLLYNAYGLIYSQVSSMILFDLKKEIFVLHRTDNGDGETTTSKQEVKLVIKGKAMPGKDVAILKMNDAKNLPMMVFSKDSLTRIGAQVFVLGYPEPATTNTFLAAEASIEPTLTAGIVSAVKRSIGGWPVIQMDAMISHGSSGSPVCNDKGEVIGLATFGSFEQGRGALASGFNFAIPVSVVKQFLDSASLNPGLGDATLFFNNGLSAFYQQFYRKALEEFEKVEKLNSSFPQLHFYIEQCNQRIVRGADKQSPPRQYVFWMMALIAFMTFGYVFYKIRKRKN